jgi:hypothetical protein
MLLLHILLAAIAPSATQPILQADIVTTEPSTAYRVDLDERLSDAARKSNVALIDVLDADGRTMPRGQWAFWNSPASSFAQDIELGLGTSRQVHVSPDICSGEQPAQGCEIVDKYPDQGIELSKLATSRFRAGSGTAMNGMASFQPAVVRQIFPLKFTVASIENVPDEASDWSQRQLVVKWKAKVQPAEIFWQIGRHVGEVTPADRATLGKLSDRSLAAWATRLLQIWSERFIVSRELRATHQDDGSWESVIELNQRVIFPPLEIGFSSNAPVELLSVRARGHMVPKNTHTGIGERALPLTASNPGSWHIDAHAPESTANLFVRLSAAQAMEMQDAGLQLARYTFRREDGREANIVFQPETLRSTSIPYDKAHPWTELRSMEPVLASEVPPKVIANYSVLSIWFENRGKPPYQLRVGEKSARLLADQPSSATEVLSRSKSTSVDRPDGLPIATLVNTHVIGTYDEPSAQSDETKLATQEGRADKFAALIVAAIAGTIVALLARIDAAFRRRSGARKAQKS